MGLISAAPYPALSGEAVSRLLDGRLRIVVIGAGGWLGLATLELLHGLLGPPFHDRVVCFGSGDRELRLRGGVTVTQRSLDALGNLPSAPSLVLHLAFLTMDKAAVMAADDYVAGNRAISQAVLRALNPIGARGVFVPSSGAAYAADDADANTAKRLYGRLKRDDETTFAAWAEREGRRAVVARVFNLSGPYINKQSSYALSSFIADALAGRPIVIKATRPVLRSYVAISELMSVVFAALTGDDQETLRFDTAGDEVLEMADVAEAARDVVGLPLPIERLPLTAEAPDHYVGEGSIFGGLRDRFGVTPIGFPRQVLDTALYMAEGEARRPLHGSSAPW